MKTYTLFASTLPTMKDIEALQAFDPLDMWRSSVAPIVEVQANNLYEAIDAYSDQFDVSANKHPVFQAGTRFFYLKKGDEFCNVKWDDIDVEYSDED